MEQAGHGEGEHESAREGGLNGETHFFSGMRFLPVSVSYKRSARGRNVMTWKHLVFPQPGRKKKCTHSHFECPVEDFLFLTRVVTIACKYLR